MSLGNQTKSTTDNAPLITVSNVSKKLCNKLRSSLWYGVKDIASEFLIRRQERENVSLRRDEFWSLQNISFEVKRGESLAIIGENGAGKSTLLKLMYGLIRPDTGRICLRGRIGAMIEHSVGFDMSLTGRENIYIRAALFGVPKKKVENLLADIVSFAEVEDFIDSPVRFYSSGMVARLGYAVNAYLEPDLLLVDEVLAVGDINFRRKCVSHMQNYISNGGSLILVSHIGNYIETTCQKGLLLERGKEIFRGSAVDTLNQYSERQNGKMKIVSSHLPSIQKK